MKSLITRSHKELKIWQEKNLIEIIKNRYPLVPEINLNLDVLLTPYDRELVGEIRGIAEYKGVIVADLRTKMQGKEYHCTIEPIKSTDTIKTKPPKDAIIKVFGKADNPSEKELTKLLNLVSKYPSQAHSAICDYLRPRNLTSKITKI